MEICGSILTNTDYTEFHLKCIYCSIESELKDWQQFVHHTRTAHRFDDADGGSAQSENEIECAPEELFETFADTNSVDVKDEDARWPQEEEVLYETIDIIKQEDVLQSPIRMEAPTSPTYNSIDGCLENMDTDSYDDEAESQVQEEIVNNMSNESDNYEEESDSSTESDSEPEEKPLKRSRHNPMSIKRKLKVSFIRQNPRVFHFIEEFKKHPCLWNPNDTSYKNEKAETEAYNAIIEGMDKKVNVLFTEIELKKSIRQLFKQFEIATQKADKNQLTGMAVRYLRKCKFLSNGYYSAASDEDDEESKSDVIQLNFKEINDMTTTFIETFGNFPVLYDSSLPDFKSLEARTEAYVKIAQMLAPELRVNETEVHLAIMRLRKWTYMTLRRVKSKELRRACTKTELHYLQLCSFLPPRSESLVINCEYCNKRFFIDYLLRAHLVKVHDVGELPYLCSQCPRRFEKAHDMERHKLRQHCEKMLKCEYCDSTFALKNDLNVHIRVHTGEKPYVCELCGKPFRLKLLLDYHINGFHLNLRPFECDICHQTYRKRVQLKNHMKAHLNIKDKKCDECGAAFTCPTSLSRHRKTFHSNTKSQKLC
ncbi:myoneurin [Drosophila montana]|uniref:myoneurin n=1 Tax=Drosophila montana TaxID=40370 RepID=UPI00313C32A4